MRHVISYDQAKEIKRRYESGETALDLADEFNVDRGTIYYSVKRASRPPMKRGLLYPISISLPASIAAKIHLQAIDEDKSVSSIVRKILSTHLSSKRPLKPILPKSEGMSDSVSVKLDKDTYDLFMKEARRRKKRPSVLGREILATYLM